jgi:hypothetical protein
MEQMKEVNVLIEKAAKAGKSEDALRFSQAALNTAHVLQVAALLAGKNPENPS